MRIISGKLKGRRFNPPKNLPVRPTTDFAKEGLFNLLGNMIPIEGTNVLDLCSGTGNISFEFASRDAATIHCIDQSINCVQYIKKQTAAFQIDNISVARANLFQYIKNTRQTKLYDIIFVDPPYQLKGIESLPELILAKGILAEDGLLIIEHGREINFENEEGFQFSRTYGNVNFTFFKAT